MKFNLKCIACNISQAEQIVDTINMPSQHKEEMMRKILQFLSKVDFHKSSPEVMGGTWDIIVRYISDDNPYRDAKNYYNSEILKLSDEIEQFIENSDSKFETVLKIAIAGNLIDFAVGHKFDLNMLKEKIINIDNIKLTIDHSRELYNSLKAAKTLLYLGDNCGEICLDKLFIKQIKKEFPSIKVYFGVKGKPILNDVTREDTEAVKIQEVAEVIDNGDSCPGTVIERVSDSFEELLFGADIILAKGQGNFESLSDSGLKNLFFLFMAKCKPVSEYINVEPMSIICANNALLKFS